MNEKNSLKKLIPAALCTMAAVCLLDTADAPAYDYTGKTVDNIMLGTSEMKKPDRPGDSSDAWHGSYVYLGTYKPSFTDTKRSIKFRVLDPAASGFRTDNKKSVFLDCDSVLFTECFNPDRSTENANIWKDSRLSRTMNDPEGTLLKVKAPFTDVELSAVTESRQASLEVKSEENGGYLPDFVVKHHSYHRKHDNYYDAKYYTVPLNGEKFFCLDASDLFNGDYGYPLTLEPFSEQAKIRKKTEVGVMGGYGRKYWTRNPYVISERSEDTNHGRAGAVTTVANGAPFALVQDSLVNNYLYISPACNIDMEKVLFSSVVNGRKGASDAEYKLTLVDDKMKLYVPSHITRVDDKVIIPYALEGDRSGNATQISVMVLDKEYNAEDKKGIRILDYKPVKRINDGSIDSGYVNYDLPSSLPEDYYVYLVAEDINGGTLTDYASAPQKVDIPSDDSTAIVMVGGLDRPVAELPLDSEVDFDHAGAAGAAAPTVNVQWYDSQGSAVGGNAEKDKTYRAHIILQGEFQPGVIVYFVGPNGKEDVITNLTGDDTRLTIDIANDTIIIRTDQYESRKRRFVTVSGPDITDIPGVVNGSFYEDDINVYNSKYGDQEKVLNTLGNHNLKLKALREGRHENPVELPLSWSVSHYDDEGQSIAGFDSSSNAVNVFKWEVGSCDDYDSNNQMLSGTISIKNMGAKIQRVDLAGFKDPVIGERIVDANDLVVAAEASDTRTSGEVIKGKAELFWVAGDEEVTYLDEVEPGTIATYNTVYTPLIFLYSNDDYEFEDREWSTKNVSVTLNNKTVSDDNLTIAGNLLCVFPGETKTPKRKILELIRPSRPERFEKEYTAENVVSSNELGKTATLKFEGETEPLTEDVDVIWSLEGATYNDADSAVNTFYWKADETQIKNYDADLIYTDGYASILNKEKEEEKKDPVPEETVSENRTSVSVNVLGDLYELNWNDTVSGNGKKHVAVGMKQDGTLYKPKNTKGKQSDIGVRVYKNGEFIDPSRYRLITKNNKRASVSIDGINAIRADKLPYFMIKFKGKEHKAARKSFKNKEFDFGITPILLTKDKVTFGDIKQNDYGEIAFKKVTYHSDILDKDVKLKYNSDIHKTDYIVEADPNNGNISIVGKNDYYGQVFYKK